MYPMQGYTGTKGANKSEGERERASDRKQGYGYAEVKRNNFWARTAKRPHIICTGSSCVRPPGSPCGCASADVSMSCDLITLKLKQRPNSVPS